MYGYIADFYCPAVGLCIEVDGEYHDPEIDSVRDQRLLAHGIRTLRLSNQEVINKTKTTVDYIQYRINKLTSPRPQGSPTAPGRGG